MALRASERKLLLFVLLLSFMALMVPVDANRRRAYRRGQRTQRRRMCYSFSTVDPNKIKGNFCPRVESKMVSCNVPNGTESYSLAVKVGNTVKYITRKRPRFVHSLKEVSEVVYGCCPGYEGDNCNSACFNCTQMYDLASRVRTLEAKILRSPSSYDHQKRRTSIKMGPADVSHVSKPKKYFRNKTGGRNTNYKLNKRRRVGGTRSDIDIRDDAGDEDAKDNSVVHRRPASRSTYGRRDSRNCRCSPGPPGPRGIPGIPGTSTDEKSSADSSAGYGPGPAGLPGPPGITGPVGSPGIGNPGLKGEPGIEGLPGERGIQGEPGFQGIMGPVGRKGEQGITGLDGLPGVMGESGPTGPEGLNGIKGENGFPGRVGDQGLPGIGHPGPQGLPGPPGSPGTNLAFSDREYGSGDGTFDDSEDDYSDYNPSGVDPNFLPFKGEKGARGISGQRGFGGYKGARGFDGVRGPSGSTGLTGLPGLKGNRGVSGQPGLTYVPGAGSDPSVPESARELFDIVGELRRSVNLLDSRIRILEAVLPKILGNTGNNELRTPERANGFIPTFNKKDETQLNEIYHSLRDLHKTVNRVTINPIYNRNWTGIVQESTHSTTKPTVVTNASIHDGAIAPSINYDEDDDRYEEGSGNIFDDTLPESNASTTHFKYGDNDYEYYDGWTYEELVKNFPQIQSHDRSKRKLSANAKRKISAVNDANNVLTKSISKNEIVQESKTFVLPKTFNNNLSRKIKKYRKKESKDLTWI